MRISIHDNHQMKLHLGLKFHKNPSYFVVCPGLSFYIKLVITIPQGYWYCNIISETKPTVIPKVILAFEIDGISRNFGISFKGSRIDFQAQIPCIASSSRLDQIFFYSKYQGAWFVFTHYDSFKNTRYPH